MALGALTWVEEGGTSNASGVGTTGQAAPARGDCLLAGGLAAKAAAVQSAITDSLGRTWHLLTEAVADDSFDYRLALYYHIVGEAGPQPRTVTASSAAANISAAYVVAVPGGRPRVVGGSPNVAQNAVTTGGDPAAALAAAPLETSLVVALNFSSGSFTSWGNSFANLDEYDSPGAGVIRAGSRTGSTSTAVSATTGGTVGCLVAVEIEEVPAELIFPQFSRAAQMARNSMICAF